MSYGWLVVFIIMLTVLLSSLYSGTHSVAGAVFMMIFFPIVLGMGFFTIYAGYKTFTGGPKYNVPYNSRI
jgi:hypothetical protein